MTGVRRGCVRTVAVLVAVAAVAAAVGPIVGGSAATARAGVSTARAGVSTARERGASASAHADATAATAEAKFADADNVIDQQAGDVAAIVITLTGTDSATVNVGSASNGYHARLDITDGNGDGRVRIRMNTYLAGGWTGASASQVYSAAAASDSVSATRTTATLSRPLDTGAYSMNATVGGTLTGLASLHLHPRSTNGVAVLTAPPSASVSTAVARASQDSSVVKGDYLAVRVDASGVFGYLSSASDLAQGANGLSLSIEQSNPPRNTAPNTLDVSTATFVPDPSNDRFYLVWDTSNLDVKSGQSYDVTFTVDDSNPFTDSTESVSTSFDVTDVSASVDTPLSLDPKTGQTITGTSTLSPGTTVEVRIRSQTNTDPFIYRKYPTIGSDGTWSTTVDFSSHSAGTDLTVVVRYNDQTISDTETATLGGSQTASPAVTIDDQSSDGTTLVVDSATLPKGGFVVIHDHTVQNGAIFSSIRGHSSYLTPGTHTNVQIHLDEPLQSDQRVVAAVYTDSNDDRTFEFVTSNAQKDTPYLQNGNYVGDVASIDVPTPTTVLTTSAIPTTVLPTSTPPPTSTYRPTTSYPPTSTRPPTTRFPTTTRPPTSRPAGATAPPSASTATTSYPAATVTSAAGTATAANGSTAGNGSDRGGATDTPAVQFGSDTAPGFAVSSAVAALLLALFVRRRSG